MNDHLKDELENCKNAQEGSSDKQFYDYHTMLFSNFLEKYYVDINTDKWDKWLQKFVYPVFKTEGRNEWYEWLKNYQAPFYPKFWIAEKFYNKVKDDARFDDELKYFFSFLYSCDFFMENIISFEEWLNLKNWQNPGVQENLDGGKSILEILSNKYGVNYLKVVLLNLPFFKKGDGH